MRSLFIYIPSLFLLWSCIESANPKLSQEEWSAQQANKSSSIQLSSPLFSSSSVNPSSQIFSSNSSSSTSSSSAISSNGLNFRVSGRIKDSIGQSITGVWLIVGKDSVQNTNSGTFSISLPSQYTGTIYPQKEGYEFYPTKEISNLNSDLYVDFEGAPIKLIITVGSTGLDMLPTKYNFVTYNQSLTVTTTANSYFMGWYLDGKIVSYNSSFTLYNIKSNHSLIAVYGTP